jgi:hypothetical protein
MADPKDPPADPTDPTDPAAPAAPAKPDPPELGDAGKKALDEERAARRAAEKLAKENADELDKLRKATMSDQEKAVAEAKAAGRQEAMAEANARLLRSEIRGAAAGKLADPGDAAALLGDIDQFLDKNGEPDSKAIASAIDALVKAKPYLAPAGARPGALPGGGARPSNGHSINDEIRQMAGR